MTSETSPDPDSAWPDPNISKVLGERWRISKKLGEGGMGAVYDAEGLRLGSRAALELLRSEYAVRGTMRERFVHEAHMAASVSHRNVVKILGAGTDGFGTPYIAMELLGPRGGSPSGDRASRPQTGQLLLGVR